MKLALQNPYQLHVSPQGLENRTLTHRMGALAGETPQVFFGGVAPSFYQTAAQTAAGRGYSVIMNAVPALQGGGVWYVNPDGTVGQLINWQIWPPQVTTLAPGSACPPGGCLGPDDPSFVPPPTSDIWFNMMQDVGVASVAAIQAAASAAAAAYAQNAGSNSNPGVNPSSYGTGSGASPTGGNPPPVNVSQTALWPFTLTLIRNGQKVGITDGTNVYAVNNGAPTSVSQLIAQVGDTWQVSIGGGGAGQSGYPVAVYGVHPDGSTGTVQVGTIGDSGSFQTSGVFDSSVVGTWQEQWSVNGQNVTPLFSFKVVSQGASSNNPPLGTGTGSGSAGNTGGTGAGGTFDMSFLTGSTIISGVPNYLIFGGGLLALLMVAK